MISTVSAKICFAGLWQGTRCDTGFEERGEGVAQNNAIAYGANNVALIVQVRMRADPRC